jgi:hypothetical protein
MTLLSSLRGIIKEKCGTSACKCGCKLGGKEGERAKEVWHSPSYWNEYTSHRLTREELEEEARIFRIWT